MDHLVDVTLIRTDTTPVPVTASMRSSKCSGFLHSSKVKVVTVTAGLENKIGFELKMGVLHFLVCACLHSPFVDSVRIYNFQDLLSPSKKEI